MPHPTSGGTRRGDDAEATAPKIVVRDRRRVDPVTGKLRPPADVGSRVGGAGDKPAPQPTPRATGTASVPPNDATTANADDVAKLSTDLAERTADLKRITAEYANHRKRVERERTVMAEQGVAAVMSALLPVLDDIERAREHGDLTGGFASVAEQLSSTLAKLGLTPFAEVGDAFDPTWHEAVAHMGDTDDPHVTAVLRRGFALGERMLRPALVVVGEAPADAPPGASAAAETDPAPIADSDN